MVYGRFIPTVTDVGVQTYRKTERVELIMLHGLQVPVGFYDRLSEALRSFRGCALAFLRTQEKKISHVTTSSQNSSVRNKKNHFLKVLLKNFVKNTQYIEARQSA